MAWASDPIDPGWWTRSPYAECARTVQFLMSFLDGELSPEEQRAFEAHLGGCEHCAQFVEAYRRATAAGKKALTRPEKIPQDMLQRLMTFAKSRRSQDGR